MRREGEEESSILPARPTEVPATIEPPLTVGDIDMCKLRDLLFSIRDNGIYCTICRCPEFSPHEMRSSHFEPCSIGSMCEKLLRLYPREGYVVKWRK